MINSNLRNYFSKELGWGWGHQARTVFYFLIKVRQFVKNGVILDAGAGNQRYKEFFNNCIHITQEHSAGIELKHMQQIKYDLTSPLDERIPLKNNSVDGILSTSVLEHLRYPGKFLNEAYRVLKPGGRIFINVPFINMEHEVPFDFQRPTSFGIKLWLEDAGFQKISVKPTSSCIEPLCTFLPYSVVYDILKTNDPKKVIRDTLKLKYGFIRSINKIILILFTLFNYLLIKSIARLFIFIIDRGPYRNTPMPVGWIAVAHKSGKHKLTKYKNKEAFLSKNKTA